jgi:hypothetical protein
MKTRVCVYVVAEASTGDRVALARTDDPQAVTLAANAVINEAEARAKEFERLGEPLATIRREDTRQLRESLARLIPNLAVASLATVQ